MLCYTIGVARVTHESHESHESHEPNDNTGVTQMYIKHLTFILSNSDDSICFQFAYGIMPNNTNELFTWIKSELVADDIMQYIINITLY